MKLLITGVSGFIGKHLMRELSVSHEVFGIEFSTAGNPDPIIFEANLLNLENCKDVLQKNNFSETDVIIHLASALANPGNLDDINVLCNNNILAANIAGLVEYLSCKKLINISSSSVYPNVDGVFNESSEINPALNPDGIYGLSKFNSEIIINKFLYSKNVTVTHLRCAMVYGEGVNSSRIWPVMESELNSKNTITVFGNGARLINQMHVSYLVKVIQKFIDNELPGTYNVSEENISMKELAQRIIDEKGNADSKLVLMEKGNRYQFKMDVSKLESVL